MEAGPIWLHTVGLIHIAQVFQNERGSGEQRHVPQGRLVSFLIGNLKATQWPKLNSSTGAHSNWDFTPVFFSPPVCLSEVTSVSILFTLAFHRLLKIKQSALTVKTVIEHACPCSARLSAWDCLWTPRGEGRLSHEEQIKPILKIRSRNGKLPKGQAPASVCFPNCKAAHRQKKKNLQQFLTKN